MDEEKDLQDFFNEMKSKESETEVPGFREFVAEKDKQRIPWQSAAAAVSILIVAAILMIFLNDDEKSTEIVIELEQEYPTETLMEENVNLMSWDTSTDYLLEY